MSNELKDKTDELREKILELQKRSRFKSVDMVMLEYSDVAALVHERELQARMNELARFDPEFDDNLMQYPEYREKRLAQLRKQQEGK